MLGSGYQLLPRDLAMQKLLEARADLGNTESNDTVLREVVEVMSIAVEHRIRSTHLHSDIDLQALADVVGFYIEFEDYA